MILAWILSYRQSVNSEDDDGEVSTSGQDYNIDSSEEVCTNYGVYDLGVSDQKKDSFELILYSSRLVIACYKFYTSTTSFLFRQGVLHCHSNL